MVQPCRTSQDTQPGRFVCVYVYVTHVSVCNTTQPKPASTFRSVRFECEPSGAGTPEASRKKRREKCPLGPGGERVRPCCQWKICASNGNSVPFRVVCSRSFACACAVLCVPRSVWPLRNAYVRRDCCCCASVRCGFTRAGSVELSGGPPEDGGGGG